MYGPAGVPGRTSTLPVAGSKVSCDGTGVTTVSVEFAGVAGLLLIVSPLNALVTPVAPDAPFTPPTVSGVATTGAAVTGTVISATAQLVGLAISQI